MVADLERCTNWYGLAGWPPLGATVSEPSDQAGSQSVPERQGDATVTATEQSRANADRSSQLNVTMNQGDEGKYRYIPELVEKVLRYRSLRVAISIAVVSAASIFMYEKFVRKDQPATINNYIYSQPTQDEADKKLRVKEFALSLLPL